MSRDPSRREFIRTVSIAGAAVGLGGVAGPIVRAARAAEGKAARPLKVLVLGGTGQTGPHLVRQLLERGHTVTLFNRGNRSEDLFPNVECLVGDRNEPDGLRVIEDAIAEGRSWDVAMDVWPSHPNLVDASAKVLQGHAKHYMFVSSISVYADHSKPNMDEGDAVAEAPENWRDLEFSMELYGAFKAECENRVRHFFPEHHTIYRPGLIVGPRDFSYRGVYWPVRVRQGGEVLAPGTGDDIIQIIDGRDLTAFQVRCMEHGTSGTFNVVGPHPKDPLTMGHYLRTCKKASGSDATFTWVPADFLTEEQIGAWMNMPCWIPAEGEYAGFGSRSIDRALRAGLTFTPLEETVRDTLTWYDTLDEERRARFAQSGVGISREREQQVLEAWHERERREGESS